MPSTDAPLQRYDLSGFAADERERIVRFIENWLAASLPHRFTLLHEDRAVVTDMPPVFVLNQIRAAMMEVSAFYAPDVHEYDLNEYAPGERRTILAYLEEWLRGRDHGGAYKMSLTGFENQVIRTNVPMHVVLGLIRFALTDGRAVDQQIVPPSQKYDLADFEEGEWAEIIRRLRERHQELAHPGLTVRYFDSLLFTNFNPRLVLGLIRSVLLDGRQEVVVDEPTPFMTEETRESLRRVFKGIRPVRIETHLYDAEEIAGDTPAALFKVTVSQGNNVFEEYAFADNAEAAIEAATRGLQGPATAFVQRVPYQMDVL